MTLEEIWRDKSDQEVVAAERHLDEYTAEAQSAIRGELERRASSMNVTREPTPGDTSAAEAPTEAHEPTRGWRRLWPPVSSRGGAREAVAFGYQSMFLVAGTMAVMAVLGVEGYDYFDLIGSVLYLGIGMGIRRGSRALAALALAIAAGGLLYLLRMGLLDALVLLGLVNGVRGTFALARLAGR